MNGKRNRTKGHNEERRITSIMKEIGFAHARTARAESNTLDACGVDISNVPLLIQCKAGYDSRYPRFPEILKGIKAKIKEFYPENHENHALPIVLVHKPTAEAAYWSFEEAFAIEMIKNYFSSQKALQKALKALQASKQEIVSLEETIAVNGGTEVEHNETYDNVVQICQELKALLD